MNISLPAAALLALFSCRSLAASEAVEPGLVWVAKNFAGGRQCEPPLKYDPPDVKRLLESAAIAVYEARIEHMAVCAACGCPAYAATHYALVRQSDVVADQKTGFMPKQPPQSRWGKKKFA